MFKHLQDNLIKRNNMTPHKHTQKIFVGANIKKREARTIGTQINLSTLIAVILLSTLYTSSAISGHSQLAEAKEYYYTRTRNDPQHLRVAEEFKNNYVDEVKYESKINGTKYEYYKSTLSMSHDELVFETIDKIFRHRLSPFYIHKYDNDEDRKRSSDPQLVSQDACARDLMYLVDKIPKRANSREPYTNHDEDHLTPELTAFFDSYARQEAGLLMGNTYWVGAYDQCVNRHIFEIASSSPNSMHHNRKQQLEEKLNPAAEDQGAGDKHVVSFKGRYCVSSLKSPTWDSIISKKKVTAKKYFKSERQFNDYSKLFRLQVGICLPSSCDSNSLIRHTEEIKLLTTSMLEQRYSDYELIDLYCLPDEASPLRAWSDSAKYFLVFMAVWCSVLFLATVADVFEFVETEHEAGAPQSKRSHKLQDLVTWFSLRANYRKIMKVNDVDEEQAHAGEEEKKIKKIVEEKLAKDVSGQEKHGEHDTSGSEQSINSSQRSSSSSLDSSTQQIAEPAIAAVCASGKQKVTRASESASSATNAIKVNLRFLNAFKVMIMFWIINGHIMLLMIQTAKNILYSDALLNGLMHFLIGATFGVDLFFTMTGFLTAYLIFNSGQAFKMKPATWLYLSFHRYWRLAPMYLLTFWFSRSVMQHLGSGPLWDYGTSSLTFRGLCNHESWWYPLTLTSNLHGLFEECLITSWYISCDMQFWLVSPIIIYLLAKHPMHGWMASLATIFMSSKVRYDAILEDQSARHDELVQPRADIFMRVSHDLPALYTHPHYRISAYLVGLLAGHYVYMVKSGRWSSNIYTSRSSAVVNEVVEGESANKETSLKSVKVTRYTGYKRRQLIAFGGLAFFLIMSFISYLLAHYYPNSLLKYAKTVSAIAYSIDHLVMSAGASLVIISMCFGQWSKIVKFLSHPHWTRLSKINYALLLLQCEAIYYQIFRYEQVPVAGTRELINILFNQFVTLYPLAFLVTIAFEFPLANIEKLLRPSRRRP